MLTTDHSWRLVLLGGAVLVLLAGCATGAGLGAEEAREERSACEGGAVPEGWPELSSREPEALLAPFLECTSPAGFVRLQRGVDMARVVEGLDDWSAVRLGALGPVPGRAAQVLNRKRASFLSASVREVGAPLSEVFALYVLHSATDADVKQVLSALARDKRLKQTLGGMAVVREQLRQRGLPLSDFPDRPERPLEDGGRGVRESLAEAASSVPLLEWGTSTGYDARKWQLPEPYQRALTRVEDTLVEQALASGHVAAGVLNELTFGMPLGAYYLVVGTGRGLSALGHGEYEQAARELTPAALLVAVYVGGKGVQALAEARGGGLQARLEELRGTAQRLREQLGREGLEGVARYLQADAEATLLVVEEGEAGAVALHEARGNVPRAREGLLQAKGRSRLETAAALAEDVASIPREALEAKLQEGELAATGSRMSGDVAVLRKQLATVRDAPPAGAENHPLWGEYVRYGEERLAQIEQGVKVKGKAADPPLQWEGYQRMRGMVTRGVKFERAMTKVLRDDAALPKAQRRFLGDFEQPRVEQYVGVWKPESGLRFADVLVIEESPLAGRPPRVETFSFKSRDLSVTAGDVLETQIKADVRQALGYYGETLDIRRSSLQPLLREGGEVPVSRVRLIYEGGPLLPRDVSEWKVAVNAVKKDIPRVEVSFQ